MTLCCSRWAITRSTGTVSGTGIPAPLPLGTTLATGGTAPVAIDYFYVIGNTGPSTSAGGTTTSYETGSPGPGNYWPNGGGAGTGTQATATTYNVPNTTTPSQIQTIKPTLDPVTGASSTTSPINLYRGVLPGLDEPEHDDDGDHERNLPPQLPDEASDHGGDGSNCADVAGHDDEYFGVLLGVPAAAGEFVCAGFALEPDGGGGFGAVPVSGRHGAADDCEYERDAGRRIFRRSPRRTGPIRSSVTSRSGAGMRCRFRERAVTPARRRPAFRSTRGTGTRIRS